MSSNLILTEKFKKEIIKFFTWVSSNEYVLKFKDEDIKEWNLDIVKVFNEPARNKLEIFIKTIMENHSISLGEDYVEDAKLLSNEFKENSKKCKKEKKVKVIETDEEDDKIKVDFDIDTYNIDFLADVNLSTRNLEMYFKCKAEKTGNLEHDHRYEWKFTIDDDIFSISDWAYTDNSFDTYDDANWFLWGTNTEHTEYILECIEKCDTQDINTLFGNIDIDSD